jgi:hypothetical protein
MTTPNRTRDSRVDSRNSLRKRSPFNCKAALVIRDSNESHDNARWRARGSSVNTIS